MVALDLISDRAKKTPVDKATIGAVSETAHAEGVMIRVSGRNIILSPPLVITAEDAPSMRDSLLVSRFGLADWLTFCRS